MTTQGAGSSSVAITGSDEIGVLGKSSITDGAGLAGQHTGGGADLLQDGSSDGETDTVLTQSGLERTSAGTEVFDFTNSGNGSLSLRVEGSEVMTAASAVDWSSLTNVPTGLDDGDDDTTYLERTGLILLSNTLAVDDGVVARKESSAGDQVFDGGTLALDYGDDRVGIGDTTPIHALDVDGTARAEAFRY